MLKKIIDTVFSNSIIFEYVRQIINNGFTGIKNVVRDEVGFNSMVLDIGCGSGQLSTAFGSSYVGIDSNKSYIEFARRKYNKCFIAMDASNLKFADEYFDCFVCSCLLHHLNDVHVMRVLSEAKRTLSKKGVGVIIDPMPVLMQKDFIRKFVLSWDRGIYLRHPRELNKCVTKFFNVEKAYNVDIPLCTLQVLRVRPNRSAVGQISSREKTVLATRCDYG